MASSRIPLSAAPSDDAIACYLAEAQPPFEGLRAIATQLAGFALLNALDPRERHLQDMPLRLAEERLEAVADGLRSLSPPWEAAHHHHHLLAAAASLRDTLRLGRHMLVGVRREELSDACEPALNEAIAHLRHATRALPGLHLVDLSQACCAVHAGTGRDRS